jgi:hypothetical protein
MEQQESTQTEITSLDSINLPEEISRSLAEIAGIGELGAILAFDKEGKSVLLKPGSAAHTTRITAAATLKPICIKMVIGGKACVFCIP